ncbi:hypothetical protein DVH05_016937 [Phytophthora capsici]|nr:hypothetical protein DVH05_016937 [Phytophthora capsici]
MGVREAAADILQVDPTSVWVVPHPRLQYLRPLWAGRRRWKPRRKDFRKLITRDRDAKAKLVLQKTQQQWAQRQAGVAHGLSKLDWKRLNRLEGVTPYQTQTVARLKANRLRLWTGEGDGFQCLGSTCSNEGRLDSAHLAWDCPDAQQHWTKWIKHWRQGSTTDSHTRGLSCKEQEDIFSMQLRKVPDWLNRWGSEHEDVKWEHLEKVVGDMWAQGCATTLTAIWRWNVDKATSNYTNDQAEIGGCGGDYQQVKTHGGRDGFSPNQEHVRVAFFYGGSRGNPGAGGSGNVILEENENRETMTPVWAASTALGRQDTTNNLAEFIGLHGRLEKAVNIQRYGIHIVGDSALILRMMQLRKPPKARKLRLWYWACRKLADWCDVGSWRHHYRQHNKMADWLANRAMDTKRSRVWVSNNKEAHHDLLDGILKLAPADIGHWMSTNTGREVQTDGLANRKWQHDAASAKQRAPG